MNRRTGESPMDFEWQNPGGPADPTSPFYKLTQTTGQRRGFESPSKPSHLSQASSFASATPFKSAAAFRNPSFTTPRKPFDADLFSENSGCESSPAENADSEATPEVAHKAVAFTTATKVQKPIFGRYGLNWGSSPGRGEVKRGRHTETALHKTKKRKRLDRDNYALLRRDSAESDDGSDRTSRPSSREHKQQPPQSEGFIGSFFTSLESRPNLPYVLSHYPQILFNYFLLLIVVMGMCQMLSVVRRDILGKEEEAIGKALADINQCALDYVTNRCAPHIRVPAMEQVCHQWKVCSERDPKVVGKASLGAHTFGQIINSFIEPISWKAMLFIGLLFAIAIGVSHAVGGPARAVAQHQPQPHVPQPWYAAPTPQALDQWGNVQNWAVPQTPSRHISGSDMHQFQIMPSQTPMHRSPRKVSRH